MTDTPYTILILDDEEAIRESFSYYFEDNGWDVWAESSAESALEGMSGRKPDCAVIDIRLPGKSGDQFISEALNLFPNMAIAICTGSPEYEKPDDYREARISDTVFSKPIKSMADLENELLHLLRNRDFSV